MDTVIVRDVVQWQEIGVLNLLSYVAELSPLNLSAHQLLKHETKDWTCESSITLTVTTTGQLQ